MHEMSIAEALVEQVRRHVPQGQRATHVCVEAGPRQAIDPQALEWAWRATTADTDLMETRLELRQLPYQMTCPRCARGWTSVDPFDKCACGAEGSAAGGADLYLLSMEVEPVVFSSDLVEREY